MKKKYWRKNVAKATLFLPHIERPQKERASTKGKANRKGSFQSISFVSKTDNIHLKTSQMDDRVCMSKQLKRVKFPYYGDRLSGKVFHGE